VPEKRYAAVCHMGEEEERELLREIIPDQKPDKIDAAQRMLALAWRCDKCGYVTSSKVPIKIPAPCVQCGSTVFRVVNR
jgi:hypothetical protein